MPPHEVWVLSQPNQVISIADERTNENIGSVPLSQAELTSGLTGFGMVYGGGKVWVAPLHTSRKIEEIDPRWRRTERWMPVEGSTGRLAWGFGRLWVPVNTVDEHYKIEALDPLSGRIGVRANNGLDGYGPEAG